jgi:hypothetical protein
MGANGRAGCGFFRASISSVAAPKALSADESLGKGTVAGKNLTVSAMRRESVDGI